VGLGVLQKTTALRGGHRDGAMRRKILGTKVLKSIFIDHLKVLTAMIGLAKQVNDQFEGKKTISIYPIPYGGIPVSYLLKGRLDFHVVFVSTPELADLFIDVVENYGSTKQDYQSRFPDRPFFTLFFKKDKTQWLIFPWEETNKATPEDIPTQLLKFIGEDPSREGLRETPTRFLRAWQYWTSGYGIDPASVLKGFEDGSENYDAMIFQGAIPLHSVCEHHLSPFFGVAHIGYIPQGKIIGLSKFSRLVEVYARRLQVQERLTQQIAYAIYEHLAPMGVGVVLRCRHTCMESRGIEKSGSMTYTSSLVGCIKEEENARSEFLRFVERADASVISI